MGSSPSGMGNAFNSGPLLAGSGPGSSSTMSGPGQQNAAQNYYSSGPNAPATPTGYYGSTPGQYPMDRAVAGLGWSDDYLNNVAQHRGASDFGRMAYVNSTTPWDPNSLTPIAPPQSHLTMSDITGMLTQPGGLQNRPGFQAAPTNSTSTLPSYYTGRYDPQAPLYPSDTTGQNMPQPVRNPGSSAEAAYNQQQQGNQIQNFLSGLFGGGQAAPAGSGISVADQSLYNTPNTGGSMSSTPVAGPANGGIGQGVNGSALFDIIGASHLPGYGYGAPAGANAANNWVPPGGNHQTYAGMPYEGGMGAFSGWLPPDPNGPPTEYGTAANPSSSPLAALLGI
jgi:hypothetical protein